MPFFLRIRNPGVCPIEGFTIFGASLSRDVSGSAKSWIIGQFGSGTKHAIALCLRHFNEEMEHDPIIPRIFCGLHGLTPYLECETITDGTGASKPVWVICIQHSGKDQKTGKATRRKEKTSNSIDYGVQDWGAFDMALREFVSNALDMSFRLWCSQHPDAKVRSLSSLTEMLDPLPAWRQVTVDVVDEAKVKGEDGFTNVYIPMNDTVKRFYDSMGRWFLQFSDMKAIKGQAVMEKGIRNLPRKDGTTSKAAVVYRKGVRVREFGEDGGYGMDSLFDYNLNDLRMDEARRVDDYAAKAACARALGYADSSILTRLFEGLRESQPEFIYDSLPHDATVEDIVEHRTGHFAPFHSKYFELTFDEDYLGEASKASRNIDDVSYLERHQLWQAAFESVFGQNAVLCDPLLAGLVQRKGFDYVIAEHSFRLACAMYGIKTSETVLTKDDLTARLACDPHPWIYQAFVKLWDRTTVVGGLDLPGVMTSGKLMPTIKGYFVDEHAPEAAKEQAKKVLAYYDQGSVYVSHDHFKEDGSDVKVRQQLDKVLMEQLAMHITGRKQIDVGLCDWFIELSLCMLRTNITAKMPLAVSPRHGVSSDRLG